MTGHFASALARLEAAIIAMSPRLPQEAPTTRMVRHLSAAEEAPREPEREVLEAVRQRLRAASSSGGEPDQRDLKRAPWVLWQGDPPAIGFPGLLDQVVAQAMRSPRALRYLIEAWLRDFSPDAPKSHNLLRRSLTQLASRISRERPAHICVVCRLNSWHDYRRC